MAKVNTEYYNLEKVAEVLSVPAAEVSRLREQGKLRGFRDGANWKFAKDEVHAYLAESIKSRGGGTNTPGDSDFDLAESGSASASSFDLLMEDAALPDDSDLVSVSPTRPKSDLDLAALDHEDDLSLAEETQISSLVVPKKPKPGVPTTPVALDDDSDSSGPLSLAKKEDSSLAVALDDEESVLGAAGSSPQLGLAGDSGFDVIVAGEGVVEAEVEVASDDLLEVEEKTETVAKPVEDFALEPSPVAAYTEDSESTSKVIAIDIGDAAASQPADAFGGVEFEGFGGFDSGVIAPAAAGDGGFGGTAAPDVFIPPIAQTAPVKAAVQEEEYSTGILVSLVLALLVMLVPGIILLDTIIYMWSWNDQFTLSSALIGPLAGLFGL